jgi:Tfp pilus assembly protein PilN
MFNRTALTLLVVTRQEIIRADFTGRGPLVPAGLWREPRPSLDDVPSLVEAALHLAPKPGRKVWVLCSDFWAQTLTMNARATAKLAGDELAQAIGFEVETLSGTSAFECVVGFAGLPAAKDDERSFWVIQVKSGDRDAIEGIIRRGGGKLAGIGHPAGLPEPLSPALGADDPSWQRVELWPESIVCLHCGSDRQLRVHVINADPNHERWHAEEENWRAQLSTVARREMRLTTGEVVTFRSDGQPEVSEETEDGQATWLTAWAGVLSRREPSVPIVRPVPQPMAPKMRFAIAAGLALAVATCCWGHYRYVQTVQLAPLQAESQRLREPVRRNADLDQQIAKLEKELTEQRQQTEALQQCTETLLAQRQRLARLLTAVADTLPEDLFVQKIDGDIGQPCLHGVCLLESQANQFAARLARTLAGDWHIKETRLKARERYTDGSPFAFQLHLKMAGAEPAPTAPMKRR